jgi:hypothetical protein
MLGAVGEGDLAEVRPEAAPPAGEGARARGRLDAVEASDELRMQRRSSSGRALMRSTPPPRQWRPWPRPVVPMTRGKLGQNKGADHRFWLNQGRRTRYGKVWRLPYLDSVANTLGSSPALAPWLLS